MEEKLPSSDFRFLDENEISTFDAMAVDPNGDTGYFVKCDIIYPESLHDSVSVETSYRDIIFHLQIH